nr:hypothetical protein [Micromonospora sp. DSM 115978]
MPVDRSEWWYRRHERAGLDVMAAATSRTLTDVTPGAALAARRYLVASGVSDAADMPLDELLRRLGVLRPDGTLTQAGSLVLCASKKTRLSLTRFDVPGGDILNPPGDFGGLALLEQIELVERDLLAFNTATTARTGFVEAAIRQIPPQSAREAVL